MMPLTTPPLPTDPLALAEAREMALPAAQSSKHMSLDKIDEVATQFEAMVAGQLVKYMFTDIDPKGGAFGGGHGEALFRDLLVQEYASEMAEAGALGLRDNIKRQLEIYQNTPQTQGK